MANCGLLDDGRPFTTLQRRISYLKPSLIRVQCQVTLQNLLISQGFVRIYRVCVVNPSDIRYQTNPSSPLDATKTSYMTIFISTWVLLAAGLICALPMRYPVSRSTPPSKKRPSPAWMITEIYDRQRCRQNSSMSKHKQVMSRALVRKHDLSLVTRDRM